MTDESTPPDRAQITEPGGRLPADRLHLLLPEPGHRPVGPDLADAEQEVLEDLGPVDGVADLRMKLEAVDAPGRILEGGDRRRRPSRRSRGSPAGGATTESPWLIQTVCSGSRPAKSSESVRQPGGRAPELPALALATCAARRQGHPLHPVAEAEHGNAQGGRIGGRQRRVLFVDALGPARQDDAGRVGAADLLGRTPTAAARPRRPAPRECGARSAACTGRRNPGSRSRPPGRSCRAHLGPEAPGVPRRPRPAGAPRRRRERRDRRQERRDQRPRRLAERRLLAEPHQRRRWPRRNSAGKAAPNARPYADGRRFARAPKSDALGHRDASG